MKHLFAALLAAGIFAGCATSGNQALKEESTETISDKIVKGKTTQQEVRATLGSPSSTNFTDSGNQIWRYSYSKATAMGRNFIPFANIFSSGANVKSKELVIFFDKDGVVRNYSMEESKSQYKEGVVP